MSVRNKEPDPAKPSPLFSDDDLERLSDLALLGGAGAIAQSYVLPAFGVAFGVLTGLLVCLPNLVGQWQGWPTHRRWQKLLVVLAALVVLTAFISALSHAAFSQLNAFLGEA